MRPALRARHAGQYLLAGWGAQALSRLSGGVCPGACSSLVTAWLVRPVASQIASMARPDGRAGRSGRPVVSLSGRPRAAARSLMVTPSRVA